MNALVLDIDETLAHSIEDVKKLNNLIKGNVLTKEQLSSLKKRLYIVDHYDKKGKLDERLWGIKRPYLDDFIDFAFKNYDLVIVWSAGSEWYVNRMIKVLFTDAGHPKPHYVFSRGDCVEYESPAGSEYEKMSNTDLRYLLVRRNLVSGTTREEIIKRLEDNDEEKTVSSEENDRVDLVKPLKHLYSLEPSLTKRIDLDKITILDNKESNFIYNMDNALLIDDFIPSLDAEGLLADDRQLPQAIEKLKLRLSRIE